MEQTIGFILFAGALFIMLIIVFVKANLVICQPNEVVIIAGRTKKMADGSMRGYRILRGGRGFRRPIIESVRRLSLNAMPIEIRLTKALSKGIIPINIDGQANVKIAGSEDEGLNHAIERFLGKNLNEIAAVAKETIEGNLRGLLATVTPEEANAQRLKLAEAVVEEASADLRKLGLVLDFVKIQNISDEQGYLEAIGRQKNAEVVKNARIAEATAEAEAKIVTAEEKRRGSVAEAQAQMEIVEAENRLYVHRSSLESKSNEAREKAKVAGEIARITEEKKLEAERILLNEKKYRAEVIIPAEAEKKASELKARGEAAKILEDGIATAEAIKKMQAEWKDGKTRDLFLIQLLPELLDKTTRVISDNLHIEKLTILDSGNGDGLPNHVKNITGAAISVIEQLKNATGLDLPGLLSSVANHKSKKETVIPKELSK
ncbi:flotillin family protein [bacterium]|nr:flotillin family protein [bacterium]RQV96897.1 MAG: flotillin family protein [bacterium]